ncbi:MAG: TonB-dependent receptor [Sulfurovum sp.]
MKKSLLLSILLCTTVLYSIELAPITVKSSSVEDFTIIDNSQTIDKVDKEKIELSQTKSIKDLSALIPNANISGIGNKNDTTITFRGISNYLSFDSSVAMYVDDVPIPFSYGFGLIDMNNIEHLEVFKGAQGTRFGKGSESGLINIYTKAPSKEFGGYLGIGYSSYNTKEIYGFISGATGIKNLNYSLSFTKETSDGYSKNLTTGNHYDTKDFSSFNLKLNYKPTPQWDILLNYSKTKSDDGGAPYKIDTKIDPFNIANEPVDNSLEMDSDILSLVVKYKEDRYELSSVTSLTNLSYKKSNYLPIMGGFHIATDVDIQEFTQEFKYKQKFEHADLLIGAFYSDQLKFDYIENQTLLSVPLVSLNTVDSPDENRAIFTQYRYYIGENYSIMGGLRYQTTTRSFSRVMNKFGLLATSVSDSSSWSKVLPSLSFSYYGDDSSHTYFTYSKGYRTGGYSFLTSDLLIPFKDESTNSYELGYKKTWESGLKLNSAIFYNDIIDHHSSTLLDTLSTVTFIADKAYSYGVEFDISYKKDDLEIYSSFGWTKAEFQKISDTAYTPYEGNRLLEVPNITASLGIKYNLTNNFYVTSSIKYMGERYYNVENTSKADAYSVTNLSLGYKHSEWLAEIYANNIFDREYVDFMIATPSNNYHHFGSPRIIGVKMSISF